MIEALIAMILMLVGSGDPSPKLDKTGTSRLKTGTANQKTLLSQGFLSIGSFLTEREGFEASL